MPYLNRILVLWATPRSTSTAFEWAMENRGDMTCFHEPYNEAYYQGEDRRNDRYFIADPGLTARAGLSIGSVHRNLLELAGSQRVFVKDFAYSVMHMADDAFLDGIRHTFLIRDPEKVITSMHAKWPDISLGEIGFEDLHTLYRRVAEREGAPPPVLDSDELLDNPEGGMRAYCEAVGIPYVPSTTRWEGRREENRERAPTWNPHAFVFHDRLRASTGLVRQKRDYPPLASSRDMMRLHAACKPHYDALYEVRLRF